MEPRGQDRVRAQTGGFAGEDEKDGLRYLLGLGWIAGLPERNRVNQADVPADQRLKGRLGIPVAYSRTRSMSFASGIYLFITAQGEFGHSFFCSQFQGRVEQCISS